MVLYSDYHDFILVNDSKRSEVPDEIAKSRIQHEMDETPIYPPILHPSQPSTLSAKLLRPILHEWFGDSLSEKKEGAIRICLQNPNGLPATNHSPKVHRLAKMMKAHDINVMGMPESRVNVHSRELSPIATLFNSYHPGGAVHHTNTLAYHPSPTTHQRGGVSVFVDSANTKRLNNVTFDPLGRWQRLSFLTTKNAFIVYILYKVNTKNKGSHKAAWDHQRFQLMNKGIHTNPEDQVVIDITAAIQKDLNNNNFVLVMGDANETLSDKITPLNTALTNLGLTNLLEHRFGTILPPTHQFGNEAIDHVWASSQLLPHITNIGIAPLKFLVGSDHRAVIFDMNCQQIFDPMNAPTSSYNRRTLKSNNAVRCIQYVEEVHEQYITQKVPSRLKKLQTLLLNPVKNKEEICILCESLDRQLYDIQMGAANKLPTIHDEPWSADYQTALDKVFHTQNEFHTVLAEYKTDPIEQKRQDLLNKIQYMREAEHELAVNREGASTHRKQMRIQNAQYWCNQKKYDTLSSSLRVIYNVERQRERATRVKNVLKPRRTSSLSYILIPARENYPEHLRHKFMDPKTIWNRIEVANGKDIKNWVTITDRTQLETLLLGWQCLHFQQASDTPFANKEWEEIIMQAKDLSDIEQNYEDEYNNLDQASKKFLDELFGSKKASHDFLIDITPEDLYVYIHKKKESTSTSPSNRHLGHWKAILNEPIFMAIFTVIKCCIEVQYIPQRWKKTITALIEKETGSPKIHRLRTIHIVEPEIQFISHYFWSKGFLRFCETQQNFITDAQYGGRQGRWAKSAILKQQLIWDVTRMQNIPVCTHLADARANFDRNLSHLVSRALIQRHFPPHIAAYYRKFLKSQCFLIRTGFGLSRGSYTHSVFNQIYGDCQGLGWSAINQIAISSVIDDVCSKYGSIFSLQDCFRRIELTKGVNYFIDDRTSNTILEPHEELDELIPKAQKYETLQQEALNAAGGALAPNKCRVWILARSQGTLQINYYTENAFPGAIQLRSTSAFPISPIPRLGPRDTFMYLGALISPKYSAKDQFNLLLSKIEEWSRAATNSSLDIDLIWQSFDTTLLKQLEYPLCASNLSCNQCELLMGKIRKTLAQKQHYSSKIPRELTHGPISLCGLNVPNLYDLQGREKLNLLKHHLYQGTYKKDSIAELLRISLADHCLWLGSFTNFFNKAFDEYAFLLGQTTYLGLVWEYLSYIKAGLEITDFPTYELPRENDKFLMDVLLDHDIPEDHCLMFNRVRMDLRLLTLSDIVYLNNTMDIHEGVLRGKEFFRESELSWPMREEMPNRWGIIFRDILREVFIPYLRNHPLGPWVNTSHQQLTSARISPKYIRAGDFVYAKNLTDTYSKVRTANDEDYQCNQEIEVRQIFKGNRIIVLNAPDEATTFQPEALTFLSHNFPEIQPWHQQIWGHRQLNHRELNYLAYKIQSPFTLMSDGGLPNNYSHGSYAYLLADTNGTIFYTNYGLADGHSDQRSSTRYEGYGHLAGISLINVLESYSSRAGLIPCSHKQRTYSCDNESICKARHYPEGDKRITKSPHSDVLIQIAYEYTKSPNHPKMTKWTRGHPELRKSYTEFTYLERLNYEADALCHLIENLFIQTPFPLPDIAPFLPQQQLSVVSGVRRFLSAKPKNFAYDRQYRALKTYTLRKFGLSTFTFGRINFEAASSVMSRMMQKQKIRFLKVFQERWITNHQMHMMDTHPTGFCPLCNVCNETQLHVMCCRSTAATTARDEADDFFVTRLNSIGTPPQLVNFITALLDTFHLPTTYQDSFIGLSPSYSSILDRAIQDQAAIGWYNFSRGMIAKSWNKVLEHHFSFLEKPPSAPSKWSEHLISALVLRATRIWKARCSSQHGDNSSYLHSLRTKANADLTHYTSDDFPTLLGDFSSILSRGNFDEATKDECLTWLFQLKHAIKKTASEVKARIRARKQILLRLRRRSRRRIRFRQNTKQVEPRPFDTSKNLWFDMNFVLRFPTVLGDAHVPLPGPAPNI